MKILLWRLYATYVIFIETFRSTDLEKINERQITNFIDFLEGFQNTNDKKLRQILGIFLFVSLSFLSPTSYRIPTEDQPKDKR